MLQKYVTLGYMLQYIVNCHTFNSNVSVFVHVMQILFILSSSSRSGPVCWCEYRHCGLGWVTWLHWISLRRFPVVNMTLFLDFRCNQMKSFLQPPWPNWNQRWQENMLGIFQVCKHSLTAWIHHHADPPQSGSGRSPWETGEREPTLRISSPHESTLKKGIISKWIPGHGYSLTTAFPSAVGMPRCGNLC